MSTNINISVGDNKLLEQARLQQAASRQAQLEREANQRLEAQATTERTNAFASQGKDVNGNPLTGTSFQAPRLERRPAANRFAKRGEFGWLPAGNLFYGGYDAFTSEAYISPTTPIEYTSKKFGVIKLGNPSACSANTDPSSYLFGGRSQELVNFVRAGGVLWIQNEWLGPNGTGCGISLNVINPYIQNLFNCSIRFAGGNSADYNRVAVPQYGTADANFLVYQKAGFTAPDFFYTDLLSPIENGTPMYSHPAAGVVVAFEKIQKGFIVLSADSNATATFPIGIFAGQQYTFIDALRTLR